MGLEPTLPPSPNAKDVIKAYMENQLDVSAAAAILAKPIKLLYSTADHGYRIWDSEDTARHQRQYCSSEEAVRRWGEAQHLCAPERPAGPTTEGLLGRLWIACLGTAKGIPWDSGQREQMRLLELVATLKELPEPPLPENATPALRQDWIWSTGTVWRSLSLLGPSARESLNMMPGYAMDFTWPELQKWLNMHAFFARLTRLGLHDFSLYGYWVLRDAFDQDKPFYGTPRCSSEERREVEVSTAVIWIRFAAADLWAVMSNDVNADGVDGCDRVRIENCKTAWGNKDLTPQRWALWREGFAAAASANGLSELTKRLAAESARTMLDLEQSAGNSNPTASSQPI